MLDLLALEPQGTLGGALDIEAFAAGISDIASEFTDIARTLLGNQADLRPNEQGFCQAVSVAWTVKARSGHLYNDTPRPENPPTRFDNDAMPDGDIDTPE